MRKMLFLFMMMNIGFVYCQSSETPNGLKFSKAIFNSFQASKTRDYINVNDSIVIPEGKVWCITSVKSFMLKGVADPFENEIALKLNDIIIDYFKSPFTGPLWLPAGKYYVQLYSKDGNNNIDFQCYLSGIEYHIVK